MLQYFVLFIWGGSTHLFFLSPLSVWLADANSSATVSFTETRLKCSPPPQSVGFDLTLVQVVCTSVAKTILFAIGVHLTKESNFYCKVLTNQFFYVFKLNQLEIRIFQRKIYQYSFYLIPTYLRMFGYDVYAESSRRTHGAWACDVPKVTQPTLLWELWCCENGCHPRGLILISGI